MNAPVFFTFKSLKFTHLSFTFIWLVSLSFSIQLSSFVTASTPYKNTFDLFYLRGKKEKEICFNFQIVAIKKEQNKKQQQNETFVGDLIWFYIMWCLTWNGLSAIILFKLLNAQWLNIGTNDRPNKRTNQSRGQRHFHIHSHWMRRLFCYRYIVCSFAHSLVRSLAQR